MTAKVGQKRNEFLKLENLHGGRNTAWDGRLRWITLIDPETPQDTVIELSSFE